MKRINKQLRLWILALAGVLTVPATGQLYQVEFIYGGIDDAQKLLQAYLEPYANILGADLNAGWYNTARPHKLGGLDVTATVSWAKAPAEILTYNPALLELNGRIEGGGTGLAPTAAGQMSDRPSLVYTEVITLPDNSTQEVEFARFTLPNGSGIEAFPLPMAQLTVGVPLGTDISARFVPMVQISDYGEIGLWGVGGKHSISQWIPLLKRVKPLDIAIQGGYTKVSSSVNVDLEPLDVEVDKYPTFNWDDQFITQDVAGWTLNLIASQKLAFLTFYQGIGYSSSEVEMAMLGHYPIHGVVTEEGADFGKTTYEPEEDPVSLNFQNINNMRLNVGARIKLSVLTLHYDLTYTLYATHSVGIGVSFR